MKNIVVQDWEEDCENSKNGWLGSGWYYEGTDFEMLPENVDVEVMDYDKFYNPIKGKIRNGKKCT